MRFTLPILAILSTGTLASPRPLTSRDLITTNDAAKAIQFAAAADCDIGGCATVIAYAACIAAALLATGPGAPAAVIACVAGGASSICPCAGCVASLGDFLEENGLCPTL